MDKALVPIGQPHRPDELLAIVLEHDRAVWAPDASTGAIALRNDAARAALDAGWSAEEIARTVRVTPVDVLRWVSSGTSAN